MKNILLGFFLLLSIKVFSANTSIISELPGNQITLQFQLGNWQLKNVGGGKNQIEAKDLTASLKKGYPEVYFASESVVLDANGHWVLSILDSSFTDFPQVDLIPSKGNIKRPISPATVPYVYGPVYQQNTFWPAGIASLGNPYIMRSERGSAVQFNPFSYNAVTKILRVYHQVTIKIERVNSNGVNPLPAYLQQMPSGSEWKEIVNKQFINGKTRTRY
jgi:gingipain R